jgi:hypothetical protein
MFISKSLQDFRRYSMPPRKAGPANTPPSPPVMKIPSPLKRKSSVFNMSNDAKKAKKVVRFEDDVDCNEPDASNSTSLMGPIQEETGDPEDECSESSESSQDQRMAELLRLEHMYDAFSNLSSECEERKRSVRLDAGEILEGGTPPSSQDSNESNCSWEFELQESSATDDVGSDDIFDFIWKYITDHQQDIYRRIGTGVITRTMAENYLRNAPRDLLQILERSLVEAERKLNQFSV